MHLVSLQLSPPLSPGNSRLRAIVIGTKSMIPALNRGNPLTFEFDHYYTSVD